jgi:hypothetical protein
MPTLLRRKPIARSGSTVKRASFGLKKTAAAKPLGVSAAALASAEAEEAALINAIARAAAASLAS